MLGCEGGVARARGPALSNKPLGDSLGENLKFDGNPSFLFFCGAQQGGKALWDYLAVQIAHKMRVNLMREKREKRIGGGGKGEGGKACPRLKRPSGEEASPSCFKRTPLPTRSEQLAAGHVLPFPKKFDYSAIFLVVKQMQLSLVINAPPIFLSARHCTEGREGGEGRRGESFSF